MKNLNSVLIEGQVVKQPIQSNDDHSSWEFTIKSGTGKRGYLEVRCVVKEGALSNEVDFVQAYHKNYVSKTNTLACRVVGKLTGAKDTMPVVEADALYFKSYSKKEYAELSSALMED